MTRSATMQDSRSNAKSLILGISLIVVAVVIAIIAASPGSRTAGPAGNTSAASAPAAAPPATALTAREAQFDFGPISMAAGNVSHRYWFSNGSAAPMLLQRIYTSCMCTTATLVKGMRVVGRYGMAGHGPLPVVNETLAPGEAAYVDVVFDPAAHGPAGLGRTERVVTIESAAGHSLQLGFAATVRP